MSGDKKEELAKALKKMEAPKMKVDYQVDTLANAEGAVAYFRSWKETITINYVEGQDNSQNESLATKAHERKHKENHDAGMKNMPMSLEQYYKVCQHDEISANMTELMQLRLQYLNAKTEEERQKIVDSPDGQRFSYYFDAIKEGKINPTATNSADFEKEMKFIATETQKMWMGTFSNWYDREAHLANTRFWMATHDYDELKSNPQNYEKAREIAYTIGGIDFRKYMDDIPLTNENIKKADQLVGADKNRKEVYNVMVTAGHPTALTSMEQHAKLSALEGVSNELKMTMEVRQQWLQCKTAEEREKLMKNVQETGSSLVVTRWLNAANNGEIDPTKGPTMTKEEQEVIGKSIANMTRGVCNGDMSYIREYVDDKGWTEVQNAIKSGEADKNYDNAKKEMFTVNGIDFSSYVREPVVANPNIAIADKTFKDGESFGVDDLLQNFDANKDLIVPEFKPIDGLSMEQQLQVAQHQMFMANAKVRNPSVDVMVEKKEDNYNDYDWTKAGTLVESLKDKEREKTMQVAAVTTVDNNEPSPLAPQTDNTVNIPKQPWNIPSDEADLAKLCFDDFKKNMDENPELKAKWDEASKQYEKQIAEANKTTVLLPSDNEKAYQKELDKIYTVNGVNLKNTYQSTYGVKNDIESYVPKVKTTEIKKVEDSSMVDRAKAKAKEVYHDTTAWVDKKTEETKKWASDKWNSFTKWVSGEEEKPKPQQKKTAHAKSSQATAKGTQAKSTEHRKKEYESTYYTGQPQYDTWSPEHRVSSVQYATIYDFTSPYLKQQQEYLAKKEAEEKAKKEQAKETALDTKRSYSAQKFDKKVDEAKQEQEAQKSAQPKSQAKCGVKTQQNSR